MKTENKIMEEIESMAMYAGLTTEEMLEIIYQESQEINRVATNWVFNKFNQKFPNIELNCDEGGFYIDIDNEEAEVYLEKIIDFLETKIKYKVDDSEFDA